MTKITLGITHLLTEKRSWLSGKSVGLLTNHTGVDENLTTNITLFRERVNLGALFSPEHGLWGAAQDGIKIADTVHAEGRSDLQTAKGRSDLLIAKGRSDLLIAKNRNDSQTEKGRSDLLIAKNRKTQQNTKVYSLYGETPLSWAEMCQSLDVLVYDMQDVGARYYTYLGTLLQAMQALESLMDTGKCVECIVADRPNPIGGVRIEGPMLDPAHTSLVGPYPLPVRYGLTIGEVATLFHAEQEFRFPFKVAAMQGWHREMVYADTELLWVPPSPNMPTLDTATLYPGTCLFEGTNVSEGRGTTKPFEHIGAPWIDAETWAFRLNALQLPGLLFRPLQFIPQFSKYVGEVCRGVAIHITAREEIAPVELAVWMLALLIEEHPTEFAFREEPFDRLAGSPALRKALLAGTACSDIIAGWSADVEKFRVQRASPYLLY